MEMRLIVKIKILITMATKFQYRLLSFGTLCRIAATTKRAGHGDRGARRRTNGVDWGGDFELIDEMVVMNCYNS